MAKKIEITGVTVSPDNIAANAVESFTALVPSAAGLLSSADERLLIQFLPCITQAADVVRKLKTATDGLNYKNADHVAAVKKMIGRAGIGQSARKAITDAHKEIKADYLAVTQQIDKFKNVLIDPVIEAEAAVDDFCERGAREIKEAEAALHHKRFSEISEYFRPGYFEGGDYDMHFPNGFGAFPEDQFQTYLAGAKEKHAERLLAAEKARLQAEQEAEARANIAALRAKRDAAFRPIARFYELTSDGLLEVPEAEWDAFMEAKMFGAEVALAAEGLANKKQKEEFEAKQKAQKEESERLKKIADANRIESERVKAEADRIAKEAQAKRQAEADKLAKQKAEAEALAKGGDKEKIKALMDQLVAFMVPLKPDTSVYGSLSTVEGKALFERFLASQRAFWKEMTEFVK